MLKHNLLGNRETWYKTRITEVKLLKCLWCDETGFVASADLILVTTVLILGVLVGLVTLRDQIVQELGDLAGAIGHLNQSYSYTGDTGDGGEVAGSSYEDLPDLCEQDDTPNAEPSCISIAGVGPHDEGSSPSPNLSEER